MGMGDCLTGNRDVLPYPWHDRNGECVAYSSGSLLASGDNDFALRYLAQQRNNVGGLNDLEELVGGIVLQASNCRGGIKETYAFFFKETYDGGKAEGLVGNINEIVFIAKEKLSFYPPMVIDEIGIEEIEIFCPSLPLRRETAKEQHLASFGKKGM